MALFHISERTDKDLTILDLRGRLGIGFDNISFGDIIRRLSEDGRNKIILNFSEVSYIDGVGLGELVRSFEKVRDAGGNLKIFGLNSRVLELMTITKLLTVFETFDDENTAIGSFHVRRNYFKRKLVYKALRSIPPSIETDRFNDDGGNQNKLALGE